MASNAQQPPPQGDGRPPKPWEQSGGSGSSGPSPFKPPSAGSTSDVVEASGTAKPGEIVPTANRIGTANTNALGRPLPARPWEQNYGTTNYGGYGSSLSYNSGYGSGMYGGLGGGTYGGMGGGMYGGGLYGNSMYRGGYGGYGGYGGGLYGSSMYGSGMYGSGIGGTMGGYGMGMGGPYGVPDPNDPYGGGPTPPPGFWISFLRVMQGVVNFFGRVSILIDQNTQAFHMFMTALLQLFDRSGMLYGELARFALRLLGVKTKPRKVDQWQGPDGLRLPGPEDPNPVQGFTKPQKAVPAQGSWDNVWGSETN
ncbi:hypothetical protein MLD38_027381 [Melastoma candidum]|uniref:Uncharacterized protein n=1 Tax=Melastoma candidum TaxID=119954 RepID=A0ACB9P2M2_9MYRT|nr:hypothetical protein MLD38_027381 [Melastoma candidum]